MTTKTLHVQGTLRVHYRGFGFLETADQESYFVPGPKLTGLLDGDEVTARVRLDTQSVTSISLASRVRTTVVGEVIGTSGSLRLRVDAATGSLTVPLTGAATAGQCVVAQLGEDGARVTEVLGDPLSVGALERRVLERHRLPSGHHPDARAEAERLAAATRQPGGRRADLRGQHVITIDDDHSQDLDDALHVEPGRGGDLRVWVHIADVAEHVRPGSHIDVQAQQTPTSIYLPTRVRHMLPETLSATALSLIPGVDRDTVTVELLVTPEGAVKSVDVYESTIRSRRRVNYATVGEVIARGTSEHLDAPTIAVVSRLWAAATRLGTARAERGGVDAFRVDPEPAGSQGSADAHLLVERLMVAANEAVAAWLTTRDMPGIFRTHPTLSAEACIELERVSQALGLYASLPHPATPRALASLASAASRSSQADLFWDTLMGQMGKASYQEVPGLHFGLASDLYLHFTSPLRRYADLVVHRVVKAYLAGDRVYADGHFADLARHLTAVSRQADAAERDMRRALALLEIRPGKVSAQVLSQGPSSARVRVGGLVTTVPLSDTSPGQVVTVRVKEADPLTGRLVLVPAATRAGAATASPRKHDRPAAGSSSRRDDRKPPRQPRTRPDESPDSGTVGDAPKPPRKRTRHHRTRKSAER